MNLDHISIVLVGTTHGGNIGATARAMGNMGIDKLKLVTPHQFPGAEATARASGADWILDNAVIYHTLEAAVSDSVYVLGTTARRRDAAWQIFNPGTAVREIMRESDNGIRPVSIVFGRESSGLSNAELDCCDGLVSIPVSAKFSSLNLASAVMVVCYELRKQALRHADAEEISTPQRVDPLPTGQESRYFFEHLEQLLSDISFIKVPNPEKLMRKIRHLYVKAKPNSEELRILRGIMTAIQQNIGKSFNKTSNQLNINNK